MIYHFSCYDAQEENALSNEIQSLTRALLHFEGQRVRSGDALSSDSSFLDLLKRSAVHVYELQVLY